MKVLDNSREMIEVCRQAVRPIGLVPTMGALHDGHLSLIRRAREENETLVVSVFVNPAQFGAGEDLDAYPRDLSRDFELLRKEGTDLVFVPSVEDVYPAGFDTWVDAGRLAGKLEGLHRPGHFRGVATVVSKLFNLIRPDRAYFGQKDGQQVVVIRQMVRDLAMGLDIVVAPTVRQSDGLALSSRNVYLTPEQRKAAPAIYRSLCLAQKRWQAGELNAGHLRDIVRQELRREPGIDEIDYVSVAASDSLDELERIAPGAMLSVAVRFGQVRLIDNVILD